MRKKLWLVFLVVLFLPACSGSLTRVSEEDRLIRLDKALPHISQHEIYTVTQHWMEENFTASATPIRHVLPEESKVVGRGQIKYPCHMFSCITKRGWLVVFDMEVNANDGLMKTIFRRISLVSSPREDDSSLDYGMMSPVWSQSDMDAIRPELVKLNEALARVIMTSAQ
jgi:hypothetical protein